MASSSPLSSVHSSPDSHGPQPQSTSSSPLSTLSTSPSPPNSPSAAVEAAKRYPSPMSSIASGTQSPVKPTAIIQLGEPLTDHDVLPSTEDGPPPAKKRRITAPKERKTEYLNLVKPETEITLEEALLMEKLTKALRKKKKIVVIAGAGISVSAGIPDFRSSTGLFARAKKEHNVKASGKHLFDASVYKHDASTQSFHTMVREMAEMSQKAKPTPFHHMLASLRQEGRLLRLYSQNIDCVDTSMEPLATQVPLPAKGPWPATIQLHGGLQKMVCTKCGHLEPFNGDLFNGPEAPLCETCKADDQVRTAFAGKRSHGIGRLRPRFVLYNEFNPDGEAIGNVSSADLKTRPDAVIVVGTTLKVPGTRRLVKELCQVTRGRRDGVTIWLNTDSEPKGVEFKDCWDIVVRAKCDDVARLAALPPWDTDIGSDYLVSNKNEDNESQEALRRSTIEVELRSSPDRLPSLDCQPMIFKGTSAIPTPRASPKISHKKQANKAAGDKPVKVTKARTRKPKEPAKKKVPVKATVLQSFKPAKNVASRAPAKKMGSELKPQRNDEPMSLPPLQLSLLACDKLESSDVCPSSDAISARPTTPTMPARQFPKGTISPTSVPNAMRSLIDVE